MALNVQFYKVHNYLTDEDIVVPRLVNQQSLDFNGLCDYLADGSTVTAADVAAVMKQIETRLPLVLGLNAKVVCSPEGLTFRPKVTGSITQKQLREKLQAKLLDDPTLDIDVNRELSVSDLTINDLNAEIGIELPKKWIERFKTKAEFKRVTKTSQTSDNGQGSSDNGQESGGSGQQTGGNGQQTGGNGQGTGYESVAAPTVSGTTPFEETTTVTMSGPAGAEIHYTTDGSAPSSESTLYSTALTLSETTTVKAVAVMNGSLSAVTTKVFVKGSGADPGDPENSED